ncbi:MAG TPA: hypothetical protein VFO07_09585, partial [Roseiflexaceae bacterium]|nr:hypothetical protein [Roseiflexaceae bacterium]
MWWLLRLRTPEPAAASGETTMLVGGILLLIVAVVCFFIARSQAGKLQAMNAADTYTAQMLSELHGRVTASLGAEALAQPCEVEGVF